MIELLPFTLVKCDGGIILVIGLFQKFDFPKPEEKRAAFEDEEKSKVHYSEFPIRRIN